MTTNYPASIDNFVNPAGTATLASPDHAGQHTDINDAVEAIETELGTSPKGSKASVKARLDDVDTAITARAVLASENTFTTNQVITGSTTAAMLRVTQTGTGNALVVEDSANPDSTPFVVDASGRVAIGGTTSTDANLRVSKTITGGTTSYGVTSVGTVQSDVTVQASGFISAINTAAASFTLGSLNHFAVSGVTTPGAGSTITNQYGYLVTSQLTGATNNYAFGSNVNAATGRWNLYMSGTAGNYLAGRLGVGGLLTSGAMAQVTNTTAADIGLIVQGAASQTGDLQRWQNSAATVLMRINSAGNVGIPTANTDTGLTVSKTITGGTTAYGVSVNGVVQSDVTSRADAFSSNMTTAAASFTVSTFNHFVANGVATFGAGSTVTEQFGFRVTGGLTGATNNYAFRSSLASGTGRWNLYMDGTAANHVAGNLCVGTTAIATSADKAIHMGNGTAPTANIASGGILYVEAGALKYRGSSGTITTIANA